MRDEPILGIDFGTTWSKVAIIDPDGSARVLSCVPSMHEGRRADHADPEHAAWIFHRLKEDAERALDAQVRDVVLTAPTHFDGPARGAIAEAAAIAGWDPLSLIDAPKTAVFSIPGSGGLHRKLLVVDVGGASFAATVLAQDGGSLSTLGSRWTTDLAGDSWDERLLSWVAAQVRDTTGHDLRDDPIARQRLSTQCVEARIALSTAREVPIALEHCGRSMVVSVERALLEQLTDDLSSACETLTDEALGMAGVLWEDLDQVLLVGGASRMPAVRERFAKRAGGALFDGVDPDNAVAIGAARQGVARHRA